jgi:hypothetical protein
MAIWYILYFGMFFYEKSGNPGRQFEFRHFGFRQKNSTLFMTAVAEQLFDLWQEKRVTTFVRLLFVQLSFVRLSFVQLSFVRLSFSSSFIPVGIFETHPCSKDFYALISLKKFVANAFISQNNHVNNHTESINIHGSIAMISLKTLCPGGIRTRVF